jgi:hypothetical protein
LVVSKEAKMNVDERIAAIKDAHATQPQPAVVSRKFRLLQIETQVAVAPALSTEKVFDIANNAVAKLMERSDLSDKGKLEAVVELLSVKGENYQAASKIFAEFEAYFTYQQSQRTRVSEQNIQRLMADLEDGTKANIEKILSAFSTVNHGVGNIKQLLSVMEKARLEGKTVESLTDAYRLNESLLKEIAADQKILDEYKQDEVSAAEAQAREISAEKGQLDEGAVSKLIRTFFQDDSAAQSLELRTWRLEIVREKIAVAQRRIEISERQRNHKLEDGDLTILRSIDATEGGFTDQIVQTARDSLDLIMSTRASIEALLAGNAKSRAACADITNSLQDTTGSEAILKGALQVVAKETHLRGDTVETEIDRLNREKAGVGGDDTEAALITVNLNKAGKNAQDAASYEQTIKTKIVSFEMLTSTHVQAEARAQQFAALVESHRELLVNLQQQALPITASALEMGLQQGVALRDGLLAAAVREATAKAEKIFSENLDGATETQGRFETEKLDQMRAAIAALGKAETLITARTDKAIEHGLASLELVETMRSSAEGVSAAMSDFQKVGAVLAAPDTGASMVSGATAPAAPLPGDPDGGAAARG